jgi:hypothetical protein
LRSVTISVCLPFRHLAAVGIARQKGWLNPYWQLIDFQNESDREPRATESLWANNRSNRKNHAGKRDSSLELRGAEGRFPDPLPQSVFLSPRRCGAQ